MAILFVSLLSFFFFFMGCQFEPVPFQSPLPSINHTEWSFIPVYDDGSFDIMPIHSNPAVANLSARLPLSYAFVCYANTTPDAFILSVVITADPKMLWVHLVWMANRNKPARGGVPTLQFENADFVLRGGDGEEVWRAHTNNASSIELEGNGNLILYDSLKKRVWQSYDHPSDTLVLDQSIPVGARLVSRKEESDLSEGSFSLEILSDGISMVYNHSSFLHPYLLGKNPYCGLVAKAMFSASDDHSWITLAMPSSCNNETFYYMPLNARLALTAIPVLRLQPNGELQGLAEMDEVSLFEDSLCSIPMKCSPYTTCVPTNGSCLGACRTDSGEDCVSRHHHSSLSCTTNPARTRMEILSGVSYFPNRYGSSQIFPVPYKLVPINVTSGEECRDLCFRNCSCDVSFYDLDNGWCFLEEDVLHFTHVPDNSSMAFIKMWMADSPPPAIASTLTPLANYAPPTTDPPTTNGKIKSLVGMQVGIAVGAVAFSLLLCVAASVIFTKRRRPRSLDSESEYDDLEDEFWQAFHASQITKFSYKHIQSITTNFSKKLGSGGFGSVYEGMLLDNKKLVAVKKLEGVSGQGAKEFRAEVAILANIHHFHLVKLLGFCSQRFERLLIYEHMPNGSLDAWLFGDLSLTWTTRHRIAIGVASRLAYLHEECDSKVLHLDIKPQNILLDENFVAKVGDFGMSRLMNRDESSTFTTMRGTPGYLAPEWLRDGVATEKMDVYSYGMVLLELISGRKNLDLKASEIDQRYFPTWALKKLVQGKELEILDSKLLDSLANSKEVKQIKTMLRVFSLCTHEDPECRPRMSLVVKMLEGEASLPTSQQISSSLHPQIVESTILSNSSTKDFSSNLVMP